MWSIKSITLSFTLFLTLTKIKAQSNTTPTTSGFPVQKSPLYLSDVIPLSGNVQSYPLDKSRMPTGDLPSISFTGSGYPTGWKTPPTDSPEVKAAVASIDWGFVPNAPVRKANSKGDLSMAGYDSQKDPDCWWSASGCVESKNPAVPPDYYRCPNVGEWGLTYDDGPLTSEGGGIWAEPHLYDFLAAHNQKAGLFYIGSNVITAPAAAQRGLANGHTICVHTWSHPAMTSLQNEAVVAELYWTLRAIKEVLGITTKCWRPPYGDVDDRVRAIAWQMGLSTVLWDEDTDDWNMPGDGGGNLSPSTVDGYFEKWIAARKNGTDNATGHVVLQHELNNSTVSMAEKWLPQIQEAFKVVPWNQCFNITQPYWETQFVYPASDGTIPANTTNSTRSASVAAATGLSSVPVSNSNTSNTNKGNSLSPFGITSAIISVALMACLIY